jgi:hypothetical protein
MKRQNTAENLGLRTHLKMTQMEAKVERRILIEESFFYGITYNLRYIIIL